MGLWYRTKTFKKVDIIKVRVETDFNINTQTRYTHWDEPDFCVTYAHYKGKLRVTNSVLYIQGTYPNYRVKVANSNYVDLTSEVYVLIFEKDSGYYNMNLEVPDYTKAWKNIYTLHSLTNYTINSSNDFTILLPKAPSQVLFFPTFKYLNIPLGLMGYYFNITQVNNRSWKIQPMLRYANQWDVHTFMNNNNINFNITNSSNLIINGFFGLVYTTTTDLSINLNLDGTTFSDTVKQSEFLKSSTSDQYYVGIIPREYQMYTNGIQNPTSNLKITYTGGSGITTRNTTVRVQRLGDNYVPYTDCELEVLVLWVG